MADWSADLKQCDHSGGVVRRNVHPEGPDTFSCDRCNAEWSRQEQQEKERRAQSVLTEPLDPWNTARQIMVDRTEQYGPPTQSLDNLAEGWSRIIGTPVTPRQVALCMVWLKVCRDLNKPGEDNIIDMINYAAMAGMT